MSSYPKHPIYPTTAWLTTNRDCNFRCSWCYAQDTGYSRKSQLTLSDAIRIIDIVRSIGVKKILLIGGEPTLWPSLFEFNRHCKERGLNTVIVTNAMRFGDDGFWDQYTKSPNNGAGISVKADSAKQLSNIAQVKKFHKVKRGISRAIEFFHCGVAVTYNNHYRGRIVELADFSMQCGARSFKIDFCTPVFIGGLPQASNMVMLADLVRDITQAYDQLNSITDGRVAFEISTPLCVWPKQFIDMLNELPRSRAALYLVDQKSKSLSCDNGDFFPWFAT